MDKLRGTARVYYGRASEDENHEVLKFFKHLDLNRDEKISLSEFRIGVQSGLPYVDEVFKKLDTNRDGALDFDDVIAVFYYMKGSVTLFHCDACGVPLPACLEIQRAMDELHEIAKSHYLAASLEVQGKAWEFFDALDSDGDEKVRLPEFSEFMRQQGYRPIMCSYYFFTDLDKDGDSALDFWEVMTLYYIIKSGRPFCSWCGYFINGIFLSFVKCFRKFPESSFNLCRLCYQSNECTHDIHNGHTQFWDNDTLLQYIQYEPRATTLARSPIPSSPIVPAQRTTPIYNIYNYNMYYVNPPNPSPNDSNTTVPASTMSKVKFTLRALEAALVIGASFGCTILRHFF